MITAYRHAAYDTPWWANPSRRPGRYHGASDPPTQYLSLHPLGPAAEVLRHHVGPATLADYDTVLLNLWAARVPEDGLVAVTFDNCAELGINPAELVGEDHAPCQRLADDQRGAGATGLIVPSAALPGTDNLVLFGVRVLQSYLAAPVIAEEIPTGHLSDGARPPAEVADLVRWIGTPHAALTQWQRTGRYESLDDPIPSRW